jgi:hypothetical protein
MSYDVALDTDAMEDLNKLPVPLRQLVETEITRLARDPTGLSRPSTFPYPQCQCMRITTDFDGQSWRIVLLFRYSQDETTIHILAIPHSVL